MANFYAFYPPSGGGSSSNASVGTNGVTAPTSSTEVGFINGSGNLTAVSPSTPLPITGSISATNPSVGTNAAAAPASSTEVGFIDGSGNLQGVSATNPLPITGSISASNPSVGLTGAAAPTSATEIAGKNAGNLVALAVDSSGNAGVNVVSSALPSGAATQTTLATVSTTLGSMLLDMTNGTQITQVSSSALPTGAATAANQATEISSLSTIATNSGTQATAANQATEIASLATIATNSGTQATSANQTNASQKTQIVDGSGNVIASTGNALNVSGSFSATITDLNVTGQSAQTALVNNILTAASGAAATDVSGYRSGSVQVVSTGTAGAFIFEGSNDNVNFQTIPVYSQLILTGTPIVAAITPTASQLIYTFPLTTRYVRLRISTAVTGGSIQAFSHFSSNAWVPAVMQIAQGTAANLNVTAGTIATVSTITSVASTTSVFTNADQASAAIVVTTTGAAKALTAGVSVSFNVNVTATAATSQSYAFKVQTSLDGTNWEDAWAAPVRNGGFGLFPYVANYASPFLNLNGIQYRYVETMSAGVSFTRTITTNRTTQPGLNLRSLVDLTMTGASTSATLHCEGLSNYSCVISGGGGSTPSLFVLDGSIDGQLWTFGIAAGWQTTTVGASSGFNYSGVGYNYIRVRSVGSGSAPNYILLEATDQPVAQPSHAVGQTVTNAYATTNITTTAYVQLIANTTYETNVIDIADSSGQAMILAIGASGGEVVQAYIPAGGRVGMPLHLPAGTRIAYKALSANATTGFLGMTFYI